MKIRIVLYLPIVLLICSCRTARVFQPIQRSKIIVKETFRDTVVNIPVDRSSFQAALGKDDAGNLIIKEVLNVQAGKRAKAPKVQIKDQVLKVDCVCDSLDIYLKLKDTHITDQLHETVFVPTEKPLSAWQQVQLWAGRALLILLAGMLVILLIPKRII